MRVMRADEYDYEYVFDLDDDGDGAGVPGATPMDSGIDDLAGDGTKACTPYTNTPVSDDTSRIIADILLGPWTVSDDDGGDDTDHESNSGDTVPNTGEGIIGPLTDDDTSADRTVSRSPTVAHVVSIKAATIIGVDVADGLTYMDKLGAKSITMRRVNDNGYTTFESQRAAAAHYSISPAELSRFKTGRPSPLSKDYVIKGPVSDS
jgi:hypothetical protein